jgi:hypothetical protein
MRTPLNLLGAAYGALLAAAPALPQSPIQRFVEKREKLSRAGTWTETVLFPTPPLLFHSE